MRKLLFTITCLAFSIIIYAQALYTTMLHGGTNGGGTICKLEQGKLTAAFNFDTPDGSHPVGKLVQASDGKLYGLTSRGGKYNVGTIYSYSPETGEYTKLKDFDTVHGAYPHDGLIQAKDGKLYGTTGGGGNDDIGVIFSYDINTGRYTKQIDFDYDNGAYPDGGLTQAVNGKLYGMTSDGGVYGRGVIFSYSPATHVFTKVTDFNDTIGAHSVGNLLLAKDGKLYGMTKWGGGADNNGVIFSLNPATGVYTKLKGFTYDTGNDPVGSLVQSQDSNLYGMTYEGGSHDAGVIFSLNPSTSIYTKLKDLDSLTGCHPRDGLLQVNNGKLYGTGIMDDGNSMSNVIFSFSPATNKYTVEPFKIFFNDNFMQVSNGRLYGVFESGGSGHIGALYSLDMTTLTSTKLRDFGVNDMGYEPRGALTTDSTGVLYGITHHGGRWGKGVIFSFNPATAVYKKLLDWDDAKGFYEVASLLSANDGKLYGVNLSTIFSFDPATAEYSKLMNFKDSNSGSPQEHLIQATNGKLYGMTYSGGSNSAGVLFSYDPSTAVFTRLYDLSDSIGKNGYGASGNLIQASDGKLYGTTSDGGKHEQGVLFSYDINPGRYTKLVDFDYFNGAHPYYGGLVQAADGKLYGTTEEGGEYEGVLFSYNITEHIYTKLYDFTSTEAEIQELFYRGRRAVGPLTQAADGKLYGIWEQRFDIDLGIFPGESYEPGGVYSFDPATATYRRLQDFDSSTGLHPKDTFFIAVPTPKGQ